MLVKCVPSWGELAQARAWCQPQLPDQGLADAAMGAWRFDLARMGAQSCGALPSARSWGALGSLISMDRGQAAVTASHPVASEAFVELVKVPGVVGGMGVEAAKRLFAAALEAGASKMMRALLDMGVRPGPDWKVPSRPVYKNWRWQAEPDAGLAWAAACSSPDIFALVKGCPPAIEAAKAVKAEPLAMAKAPIGRLLELAELGVPIDKADSAGRYLPHVWAEWDSIPRDGWASLARKHPEIEDKLNRSGLTGRQIMAGKLQGKQKDDFLAAFARHEIREIKKELGPRKKAPAAAPARQRL